MRDAANQRLESALGGEASSGDGEAQPADQTPLADVNCDLALAPRDVGTARLEFGLEPHPLAAALKDVLGLVAVLEALDALHICGRPKAAASLAQAPCQAADTTDAQSLTKKSGRRCSIPPTEGRASPRPRTA